MDIYERKSISMSCTSVNRPNKRVEVENCLHLLLYMEKEKAKKDVLGEGLPIYDGIDFACISFPS